LGCLETVKQQDQRVAKAYSDLQKKEEQLKALQEQVANCDATASLDEEQMKELAEHTATYEQQKKQCEQSRTVFEELLKKHSNLLGLYQQKIALEQQLKNEGIKNQHRRTSSGLAPLFRTASSCSDLGQPLSLKPTQDATQALKASNFRRGGPRQQEQEEGEYVVEGKDRQGGGEEEEEETVQTEATEKYRVPGLLKVKQSKGTVLRAFVRDYKYGCIASAVALCLVVGCSVYLFKNNAEKDTSNKVPAGKKNQAKTLADQAVFKKREGGVACMA
jgi:hypothetical protein